MGTDLHTGRTASVIKVSDTNGPGIQSIEEQQKNLLNLLSGKISYRSGQDLD